ncbi:Proteinase R [Diplonema papillatum]|nr:Proteinase R [Diplonema papillatum]
MFRAFGLLLLVGSAVGVTIAPKPNEYVEGSYVMSLRSNITDAEHDALVARFGGKKHKIGKFRAMTAKLGAAGLQEMSQLDHLVKLIEYNGIVRTAQSFLPCNEKTEVVGGYWGLVRTTVESASEASSHEFNRNAQWGQGVDAYILDTGIQCTHPDLVGRCESGANFVGTDGTDDLNGHGTHCAGTVGGTLSGIAKSTKLIAVKVLSDFGGGTFEGLIEGMDWVVQQKDLTRRPSIASMSLGGFGVHQAVINAANAAQAAGVHMVAAAGNSADDACGFTPAAASDIMTVGSTEWTRFQTMDYRSPFSNYGTCVDMFAPGTLVLSCAINGGYTTLSGTSMACPHVAGVLAAYLTTNPTATPAAAKQAIIDNSMAVDIQNRGAGSPDRMLHIGC